MGSIVKAFKKITGHSSGGGSTAAVTPAPEIGIVAADTTDTTNEESEKEQVSKGKKKGKKGLKIDRNTAGGHAGRNIT